MPATKSEPMDKMTFTVPARVKKRAQHRSDVNWSAIVSKAIEERLASLELVDRLAAKSRLTEADVDEVADLVDSAMAKHFGLVR